MNPLTVVALAAILGAFAFSAWRRALLSLTLAILIVIVYLLDYVSWTLRMFPTVGYELAWQSFPTGAFPYVSPPWTVVTTIFVHAGVFHLMFNLLGFLLITPLLEERIGTLRWGLLFFGGAMAGQLVFWLSEFGQAFAVVGASGGLLAVLAAFARLYPREKVALFLPLPGLPAVPVMWVVIGYLLVSLALSAAPNSGIAWQAHLGGIAFGFAAAPLVMRIPAGRSPARLAAVNFVPLEPLATTRELRQILEELKTADVPEVRAAWLEKFAAKATCPTCGGPLRYRRGRLASTCGWRQPV